MNRLSFIILFQVFFFVNTNIYPQEKVGFNFSTAGEIEFIVTDIWNRRTGLDPRGSMTQYTEIPDAEYGAEGYSEDMSFVTFTYAHFSPDDDGTYEVTIPFCLPIYIQTNAAKVILCQMMYFI